MVLSKGPSFRRQQKRFQNDCGGTFTPAPRSYPSREQGRATAPPSTGLRSITAHTPCVPVFGLKLLTLTDLRTPLLVHWYLMWYFSGKMSMLAQVGGGDHLTCRFFAFRETWTSTGGSGFTVKTPREEKCYRVKPASLRTCALLVSHMSSNMKLDR